MDKTRLRGHNLDLLYRYKYNELPKDNQFLVISKLYDEAFALRFRQFAEAVNLETVIEMVHGLDDICSKCECPYSKLCETKNSQKVLSIMNQKSPEIMTPKFIQEIKKHDDNFYFRKYGLKEGETYVFGNIHVINKKTNQ